MYDTCAIRWRQSHKAHYVNLRPGAGRIKRAMFRRAKEGSGRGTTSRSCYYRGSGLVQCPLMYTWGTSCPSQPHFSGERLYVFSVCFGDKCLLCSLSQGLQKGLERGILGLERLYLFSLFRCPLL